MLFATLTANKDCGPELLEQQLLLGSPLYLFCMCLRDDRKSESSKIAKALTYTKTVVLNVGLSVLF